MPVMIDQEPLAVDELGFLTVGQILSHVRKQDRLVVNLLIDGRRPDLDRLADLQQSEIGDRAIFVETSDTNEIAIEVLDEVEAGLIDADLHKADAAELLQQDKIPQAMDRLRTCFSVWQVAQDSVVKTAELFGLTPDKVWVNGRPLEEMMGDFSLELRNIRQALQARDYVLLTDMLLYETADSSQRWTSVLRTMRSLAA